MMFDLILDGMNGFSAKVDSIVPLERSYFPHDPRGVMAGSGRLL
jgi:hypothetical protein